MKIAEKIPLKQTRIGEGFWSRYQALVREVAIPYQWEALNDRVPGVEPSHAIENFRIAAGLSTGTYHGMVFQDSDVGKWIESAAYRMATHPDPVLAGQVESVVEILEKAQQPDGYLNTYYTLKEPGMRWTNLQECHELYCAGHLIEAGAAWFQATGSRRLLDICCRMADCIDRVFGPGPDQLQGYDGHQEIELALVRLYEATGEARYLRLAGFFLDIRGTRPSFFDAQYEARGRTEHFGNIRQLGAAYFQDHLPVREQSTAEGHAVRVMYMICAMADVAARTEDQPLLEACRRIFANITGKRMYLTGAIGSTHVGESFTFDYDLPGDTAYAETCAAIGFFQFASRMNRITGEAAYAHVMERTLYNSIISGMSQDGTRFFYVNPLEVLPEASAKDPNKAHVRPVRPGWFTCACCPPNLTRLLGSLGEHVLVATEECLAVNLYIAGSFRTEVKGQPVTLTMDTTLPWHGNVSLKVSALAGLKLKLLCPPWAGDTVITLQGQPVTPEVRDGYWYLEIPGMEEAVITMEMAMPVRRVRANPGVRQLAGRVALMRGPLVYALEEADNGKHLHGLMLPADAALDTAPSAFLSDGVDIVTAGWREVTDASVLYSENTPGARQPVTLRWIPYFAWANRGEGEMTVWVRES